MKIRTGFVSNSSSSSFCIYGVAINKDEIMEKLGLDDIDDISSLLKPCDLGYWDMYDDIYIGCSWPNIKDYETGGEFKIRIMNSINKILNSNYVGTTHEEEWCDG